MKYLLLCLVVIFNLQIFAKDKYGSVELSEKEIAMNLNEDRYLILIKEVVSKFKDRKIEKNDKELGVLSIISHKNMNYKVESGQYKNIPYFKDLQLNVSKDKNENYWARASLIQRNGFYIEIYPVVNKKYFSDILGLKSLGYRFEERLEAYIYIYQIDDLVVEFYVKKDNFNNEDYPKKFQAIKMYYK